MCRTVVMESAKFKTETCFNSIRYNDSQQILRESRPTLHPAHFHDAKLSFDKKISVGRALCLRKDQMGEWDMLVALNELRNVLAHNLNSPKQRSKVERLRTLAVREASRLPEAREYFEASGDKEMILYSCGHILGFLGSFAEDAKGLRAMLHAMDRGINPDLPEFVL